MIPFRLSEDGERQRLATDSQGHRLPVLAFRTGCDFYAVLESLSSWQDNHVPRKASYTSQRHFLEYSWLNLSGLRGHMTFKQVFVHSALTLLFQLALSQVDRHPDNFKAFACSIDDSEDKANISFVEEKRELAVVIVDKRQVPRLSLPIFTADKSTSMDWEGRDERMDAHLTINWLSLGYRMDVYPKDKSKHFQISGQCKRDTN